VASTGTISPFLVQGDNIYRGSCVGASTYELVKLTSYQTGTWYSGKMATCRLGILNIRILSERFSTRKPEKRA
jgi:hypothetical protein